MFTSRGIERDKQVTNIGLCFGLQGERLYTNKLSSIAACFAVIS